MDELLKKPLVEMTDDEVFRILDSASDEVKRRNELIGPSISNVRSQPIEKTVESFLGALAELGVHIKKT